MKKIYSLLICIISFSSAIAQNANAVVFSELGEKFTLYINGVQINANPQANVKATGLSGEFCQARIDFEDAAKVDFAENNFRIAQGIEVTYMVKLNKKGAYVLRFSGEAAITNTSAVAGGASKVDENVKRIAEVDDTHAVEVIETEVKPTVSKTEMPANDNKVTVVETTTTTTTKPTTTKPTTTTNTEKVNMGINIGGINMGVNVNVEESGENVGMDMDMNVEENTKVTTTTTTTKTTTSGTTTSKPAVTTTATKPAATAGKPNLPTTKPPVAVPDNKPTETIVIEKTGGCAKVMTDATFASAKKNIGDKGFEDTKLSTAKNIAKINCMSAAQIKEVCSIFGFEDSKLEFAKFAYDYCFDQSNYFIVNEAFNFSDSTDELNKYIESK